MASVGIKVDGLMVAIVGVAALGAFIYFKWGDAIKETVTVDLNPTNEDNLANRGFNAVTSPMFEAATGQEDASLADFCLTYKTAPGCNLFEAGHQLMNWIES